MVAKIIFSSKTKNIRAKLSAFPDVELPHALEHSSEVCHNELVNWLEKEHVAGSEQKFLLESFHASLLIDLFDALPSPAIIPPEEKPGWFAKSKFILLTLAGLLYGACEGFDGVATVLGMTSMSPLFIFAIGLVFSVISVILFYEFELSQIASVFNVKIEKTPRVIDVYLQQIETIKGIRKKIDMSLSDPELNKNIDEVNADISLVRMLSDRYSCMDEARSSLISALDNPGLQLIKTITAGVISIIYFSGGFLSGQTVAMGVASLFVSVVNPTFWPIMLASILIGGASLSVYWFLGRPEVENLIGRWMGLDKEKIDKLGDAGEIQKEQQKLLTLQRKLENKRDLIEQLNDSTQQILQLQSQLTDSRSENSKLRTRRQAYPNLYNDVVANSEQPAWFMTPMKRSLSHETLQTVDALNLSSSPSELQWT